MQVGLFVRLTVSRHLVGNLLLECAKMSEVNGKMIKYSKNVIRQELTVGKKCTHFCMLLGWSSVGPSVGLWVVSFLAYWARRCYLYLRQFVLV